MYINPKDAIKNGWITHPSCSTVEDWEDHKFVSPNAIDFTLDNLFNIYHENTFILREDYKQMRGGSRKLPVIDRESGQEVWYIEPNTCYDGLSNIEVKLPEGVACELIIRSTLNRNGIFLTSGLYDSGFEGNIGFALHNNSGTAKLAVGVRIGQIKFISSDSAGTYAGGYNNAAGYEHIDRAGGVLHGEEDVNGK